MFTLAEAEDLVIICGEFNSGVEIINESWEPEQVFSVTKIIQHPDYKPTTVGKNITHAQFQSHNSKPSPAPESNSKWGSPFLEQAVAVTSIQGLSQSAACLLFKTKLHSYIKRITSG